MAAREAEFLQYWRALTNKSTRRQDGDRLTQAIPLPQASRAFVGLPSSRPRG
jgi:predicted NAD/FAD-dependent oxidoreductase